MANGLVGGIQSTVASADPLGRFPANLILDGSAEVAGMFPNAPSAGHYTRSLGKPENTYPNAIFHAQPGYRERVGKYSGDTGSAARFFQACPPGEEDAHAARLIYCAKAGRAERDCGCEGIEERLGGCLDGGNDIRNGQDKSQLRLMRNCHPTVKPVALMRYLCRLITPPGGIILDCFAGSGSTGIAAIAEGFLFVGVELDADYAKIAEARIETALMQPRLMEA